jgi:hypothetical protein
MSVGYLLFLQEQIKGIVTKTTVGCDVELRRSSFLLLVPSTKDVNPLDMFYCANEKCRWSLCSSRRFKRRPTEREGVLPFAIHNYTHAWSSPKVELRRPTAAAEGLKTFFVCAEKHVKRVDVFAPRLVAPKPPKDTPVSVLC